MSYIKRYITKEDFDRLEVIEDDNEEISISVVKDNIYTEEVNVSTSCVALLKAPLAFIFHNRQRYGYTSFHQFSEDCIDSISPIKKYSYLKKIYLPTSFFNKVEYLENYPFSVLYLTNEESDSLLDFNNKLQPNYKKGLKI